MIIDARELEDQQILSGDVCVVGAGAAGIVLALQFARAGFETVLLESGGYRPSEAARDLNRGRSSGIEYEFADGCRSRYLGGSTNCWGGWCRPLEAHDFERRPWVPHSGWPISAEHLQPYQERTHEILRLGPMKWDIDWWTRHAARTDLHRLSLGGNDVIDIVSQFSPPVRMGREYRQALRRDAKVRVYLHANAVELNIDRDARRIAGVSFRTTTTKSGQVRARIYILAAGGIENARLLLTSDRVCRGGIGNGRDLVGRFFMDHPRLAFGEIRPTRSGYRNKLYDHKFHYQNRAVSYNGTRFAGHFALTTAAMAREKTTSAHGWLSSVFPGEDREAANALIRLKHAASRGTLDPRFRPWRDVLTLLAHPVDTIGYGLSRLLHPPSLVRYQRLYVIIEPVPNRDSRVMLDHDRDAFGMRRVNVRWRLGEQDRYTFNRACTLIADAIRASGSYRVDRLELLPDDHWPESLVGTWHHMGTTRMSESPATGVVDPDCRVHGVANLYVAGSSVFPTAGANFPTMTVVALALRLADHVVARLRSEPDAVAPIDLPGFRSALG